MSALLKLYIVTVETLNSWVTVLTNSQLAESRLCTFLAALTDQLLTTTGVADFTYVLYWAYGFAAAADLQ